MHATLFEIYVCENCRKPRIPFFQLKQLFTKISIKYSACGGTLGARGVESNDINTLSKNLTYKFCVLCKMDHSHPGLLCAFLHQRQHLL